MRSAKRGVLIALVIVVGLFAFFSGRKPVKEVPPAHAQSVAAEVSAEDVVTRARSIRASLHEVSRSIESGNAALDAAEATVDRVRGQIAEIRDNDQEYDRGRIDAKQFLKRRNEVTARAIAGLEAK